jgi:DNA-binding beta-propeller fold protein YncE
MLLACALPLAAQFELMVTEKVGHTVGFYGANGKRIAGSEVNRHPHEILADPDGRHAYVSENGMLWMTDPGEGGNSIAIFDLKSRQRAGRIELGKYHRPHGMDMVPGKRQIVSTIENPDGLLLIDVAERRVLRFYDLKGDAPHMVTMSPDAAWAYVSAANTSAVAAVELATGKVVRIKTGARPQGSFFSADGRSLFVTESDGNAISIVDPEKKEVVGRIATGQGPGRVRITPDGKTLVYNLQAGKAVGFADLATRKETGRVDLPGPPLSLSLSPDGKWAYAGVQSLDRICVLSIAERKIIREIKTPPDSGPDAVFAISRGKVKN